MSSLKMTFSLASLVILFVIGFATLPVVGHDDPAHTDEHPTVSITRSPDSAYGGADVEPADVKGRNNFKVRITASVSVNQQLQIVLRLLLLTSSDVSVAGYDGNGSPSTGLTVEVDSTIRSDRPDPDKHEWIVPA